MAFMASDCSAPAAVLSNAPPFSALSESERAALLRRLCRRLYPSRAAIVQVGEPSCFVLLSGEAKLMMCDPDGRQVTLASLRPGDLFGEIEGFELHPHGATVVATSACEVLRMPTREVAACMTAHPRAALLLVAELSRRLRTAYAKIASFALDDVHTRVAQALLDGAERDGSYGPCMSAPRNSRGSSAPRVRW